MMEEIVKLPAALFDAEFCCAFRAIRFVASAVILSPQRKRKKKTQSTQKLDRTV